MKLIAILIGLLLVAASWALHLWFSSASQLQDARYKLDKCTAYAHVLNAHRNENLLQGVADIGYDCSRDIIQLLNEQDIPQRQPVRFGPPQSAGSGLTVQLIDNPINQRARMQQILGFLLQADSSEVRYYTSAITLAAPASNSRAGQAELWDVTELDLRFVSRSNSDN